MDEGSAGEPHSPLGGVTAHPFGLYLVQVEYRDEFELPERYIGPHFLTGFSELDG
jgi:tRNA pseudouridine38-40 synthase